MPLLLFLALPIASVTDKVADWGITVIGDLGLAGIFLLMAPESACIPIPSEPTMLAAGFNAWQGDYSWVVAALVASVANLVGSWIAYAAGRYGRVELLERQKFVHISQKHLEWADRFFERFGDAAVFFGRMLPIVRTFISLPAGVARMPFARFSLLTFLGAVPFNAALVGLGYQLGANWEDARTYFHYVDYVIAAVILAGLAFLAVRWWRGRGRAATDVA
jgi:membrane protein DedA with SNARE-associated domain